MIYYAGFDTDTFPGQAQLDWMKANTNLSWCGYYLAPAPSHDDTGWMGNRQALIDQGWGLLPIYLGQQTAGPGSHNAIAPQGSTDGSQAAQLMQAEGFASGTYVFIDWEDGGVPSADAQAYLCAWVTAVMESGYQPGIYCSHDLADTMASLMATLNPAPELRIWAWNVPTITAHAYTCSLNEFPADDPSGCGYPDAVAWQCQQNAVLALPGAPNETMQADLSSASLADPSAPVESQ
ncbi:glycoside hydrolase domain-containing protein [Trinickia fusca]|uniref:DUF1906 domain-containing protein n=1 Tax=Trinickia fusca TaxID=2419777 RepID=A0A494X0F3_9BURK|nr:glycoside hydrolase domain-containing protein [Trinickia fusca]RKP44187.1 DUF1906 domain-containing protein [Trinickia fusca]